MGFDLYATARLMKNIGLQFILHSGHQKLIYKNGKTEVTENGLWQGTIVYLELQTATNINPNDVVNYRTNADDIQKQAPPLLKRQRMRNKNVLSTFRNSTLAKDSFWDILGNTIKKNAKWSYYETF